jgi:hypothetical protein
MRGVRSSASNKLLSATASVAHSQQPTQWYQQDTSMEPFAVSQEYWQFQWCLTLCGWIVAVTLCLACCAVLSGEKRQEITAQRGQQVALLSDHDRDRLEDMLRRLTAERTAIAEVRRPAPVVDHTIGESPATHAAGVKRLCLRVENKTNRRDFAFFRAYQA